MTRGRPSPSPDDATVVVVPVLGRPHRVEPLLASFWEATSAPHRLLFVCGENDEHELAAIRAAGADLLEVPAECLTYPQKVNAALRATDEPWLFLAADDVHFHVGWLDEAHRVAASTGALVVGTNDLGNLRTVNGEHSTHTLVARSYALDPGGAHGEPGTILHEGYRHWYCDDELIDLARSRGVWAPATSSVVEHLHPFHGKAPQDAVYRAGSMRKAQDRRRYVRRRSGWT